MQQVHEPDLELAGPALIITYGSTARKHRPLDRDVIVLGRGRGCDLTLASPEIAPIHCIIARGPAGWSIRDCGSRAGTRVGGELIEAAPLGHGDIVRIGPFCFRAHLPMGGGSLPDSTDGRATLRLMRSRRNLALLALAVRRRLCDERSRHRQELDQLARSVQDRLRTHEERARQLAEDERELAVDREILEQEFQALQERVLRSEHELAQRQAEVEADLKARWQQFRKRCEETEQQLRQKPVEVGSPTEEMRLLELRRRELGHFARHLQRLRDR